MEVLLEVVLEREVEERPAVGGQLHRGRQAALHDGEVAGGQVPVEVVDVADDLESVVSRQRAWVDSRAGDDDRAQSGYVRGGEWVGLDHPAEQVVCRRRIRRRSRCRPARPRGSRARRGAPPGRRTRRDRSRSRSRRSRSAARSNRGSAAARVRAGPGRGRPGCRRRSPGRAAAGSARCARPSRRCSRPSGTPRARRRRASAASRRSRSASSTRRA